MLEVCVDSIESALAAATGGAKRLELCSALSEGGLTPTLGLFKTIKIHISPLIPIFVMLRPRRGNDFIYSEMEMECILSDMNDFKEHKVDGFVFGALKANRQIDEENCKRVIENCSGLPVTFHRAFDLTKKENLKVNCYLIKNLGFNRLLTSGLEKSAELGVLNIKEICSYFGSSVKVMPGAGINLTNLKYIMEETGCEEFHASARTIKKDEVDASKISMGSDGDSEPVLVTDVNIVRELVGILTNL